MPWAPSSVILRTFAGGELDPALHGRGDLVKYSTALRRCRNFLVRGGGGVANRPGLRYIATCKNATSDDVTLMRYVSEVVGESILIEHGLGYLRFYKNGARVNVSGVAAWSAVVNYVPGDLVVEGGVHYYSKTANLNQQPPNATHWYPLTGTIYEVPLPQGTNLYRWVQSGRVITLTHPDVPPQELRFEALTRWIVSPITTAPSIAAPAGPGGSGTAGALTFKFVITAVKADTYEESLASSVATVANVNAPTQAAPISVTWTNVGGAVEYNVYTDNGTGNGVYGFIGTASGTPFKWDGLVPPDFEQTPPLARVLFNSANNYPATAAYYQQRRIFAFTNLEPDAVFGSQVGFHSNFSIRSPLQDDDAITFKIAGNNHHPVRHLVGLKQLVALTDAGAWSIGAPKEPLTPSSIPADQESYVGSHDAVPVVVGNTLVFVQRRGNIIRDLRFNQDIEGFGGRDLTIYASHLLEGRAVGAIDYQHAPHSIVWATHGGSTLLGLTYIPEEEVWGWHRHDSAASASFNDVCVVPESDEDGTYVVVSRSIPEVHSDPVFYIERLASRVIGVETFDEDVFFVDSGLSYSGAPATVFTGLDHLEGQVVAVVADGAVVFNGDPAHASAATYTVNAGQITIPTAASEVHIGLAIRYGEIETLDADAPGSEARDKKKRIGGVTILVDRSSRSFSAGPDSSHLRAVRVPPWSPAADEHTGQVEVVLSSTFAAEGRVFIRQTDPLPLTILAVIPNGDIGG